MIDNIGLYEKNTNIPNIKLANEFLELIYNNNIPVIKNIYNKERAILELEIHNKTTKEANIRTFGFDDVILNLKLIKDPEVYIIDIEDQDLIKIFKQLNNKVIGVIGVKKKEKSQEEKDNIMKWVNGKL